MGLNGLTKRMEKPKRWTTVWTTSLKEGPLIDCLMGVEQNSVNLSRILVVGCSGLIECEVLVGVTHRRRYG